MKEILHKVMLKIIVKNETYSPYFLFTYINRLLTMIISTLKVIQKCGIELK